jgi:hypothetical protein
MMHVTGQVVHQRNHPPFRQMVECPKGASLGSDGTRVRTRLASIPRVGARVASSIHDSGFTFQISPNGFSDVVDDVDGNG